MLLEFRNNFQNAWQNECPEEYVDYIDLYIPPGSDVDDPIEDDAFMARIGAKEICGFTHLFEMKNTVTGMRFTLRWNKNIEGVSFSNFSLRREEKIV